MFTFYKKSGVSLYPGKNVPYKSAAISQLKAKNGIYSDFAHRIDAKCEGIVLAADNLIELTELRQLFKLRQVQKTYIAYVHPKMPNSTYVCNDPILDQKYKCKVITSSLGKNATTYLNKLKDWSWGSKIIISTYGGRKHQIRAHLQKLKHPILGDEKYCGCKVCKLNDRVLLQLFAIRVQGKIFVAENEI